MKSKFKIRSLVAGVVLGFAGTAQGLELPLIASAGGLGALNDLPLLGSGLGDGLLVSSGVPILSDLPIIGGLPLVDGRGIPVIRDVDGALMLASGVLEVVVANNNLHGGLPLIGSGDLGVVDMLLNGGPTLNFLGLGAVLPF